MVNLMKYIKNSPDICINPPVTFTFNKIWSRPPRKTPRNTPLYVPKREIEIERENESKSKRKGKRKRERERERDRDRDRERENFLKSSQKYVEQFGHLYLYSHSFTIHYHTAN